MTDAVLLASAVAVDWGRKEGGAGRRDHCCHFDDFAACCLGTTVRERELGRGLGVVDEGGTIIRMC